MLNCNEGLYLIQMSSVLPSLVKNDLESCYRAALLHMLRSDRSCTEFQYPEQHIPSDQSCPLRTLYTESSDGTIALSISWNAFYATSQLSVPFFNLWWPWNLCCNSILRFWKRSYHGAKSGEERLDGTTGMVLKTFWHHSHVTSSFTGLGTNLAPIWCTFRLFQNVLNWYKFVSQQVNATDSGIFVFIDKFPSSSTLSWDYTAFELHKLLSNCSSSYCVLSKSYFQCLAKLPPSL
jgi:hypothetical protein